MMSVLLFAVLALVGLSEKLALAGLFGTEILYGSYGTYGEGGINSAQLAASQRFLSPLPPPLSMPGQVLNPSAHQMATPVSTEFNKTLPKIEPPRVQTEFRYNYPTLAAIPEVVGRVTGPNGPVSTGYWGSPSQRFYNPEGYDNYVRSIGPGTPPNQPGQNAAVPLGAITQSEGAKNFTFGYTPQKKKEKAAGAR